MDPKTTQEFNTLEPRHITDAPFDFDSSFVQIIVLITVIILVFSFVGNLLAICSLARNKNAIYPWFFNLALSDLIKTVFCMPYSIYLICSPYFATTFNFTGGISCQLFGYLFNLTLLMSLISNTCVALDRVYATYFPFHYANNMKKCKAQYLIAVTWVFVGAVAAMPFFLQITSDKMTSAFQIQHYIPMCIFDIWDVQPNKAEIDIVVLYYTFIYIIPVFVIVSSTCLVMRKLLPKILAERKLNKTVKKSTIIQNSTALGDGQVLSTIADDNMATTLSTDMGTPTSRERKNSKFTFDNLLKLHSSIKKKSTKGQMSKSQDAGLLCYWRAIQTMVIVSIAFVLCNVTHIMYWVLYPILIAEIDIASELDRKTSSLAMALACLKTGQIILVYFDCAVNVMVYYSRCTLIKESMMELARTFFTFLITPIITCIRNRANN